MKTYLFILSGDWHWLNPFVSPHIDRFIFIRILPKREVLSQIMVLLSPKPRSSLPRPILGNPPWVYYLWIDFVIDRSHDEVWPLKVRVCYLVVSMFFTKLLLVHGAKLAFTPKCEIWGFELVYLSCCFFALLSDILVIKLGEHGFISALHT